MKRNLFVTFVISSDKVFFLVPRRRGPLRVIPLAVEVGACGQEKKRIAKEKDSEKSNQIN